MNASTRALRLLVLTGAGSPSEGVVRALRELHEVVVVDTMDAALEALRKGAFDLVFSDAAGFLPLERAVGSQQSGLILDTIGEGICISDGEGTMLWANRRMRQWPEAVRERVGEVCRAAFKAFAGQAGEGAGTARSRKFPISIDETQYFEVMCSPVVDGNRRVTQVVAICWDATSGRRLQQKINAIDHAGRELVRLEGEAIAKLDVGQRLKLLEEKIIKYCRQLMQFDHFAIRLLDRRTNKLEHVISVGMPSESMEMELYAESEGNGICGHVAATKTSYICADVAKDSRYVPGLSQAQSSLTVPLMLHDKVIGVFNIESQRAAAFSEDDRQFAEIFGRYVAVALNILDLLVFERYTTTGQLAQDVSGEVSGPLNDIASEVTLLMDEYIGDDAMRQRLQSILGNVTKIRQSLKEVGEGPRTILGLEAAGPAKQTDPELEGKRVLVADDEPAIRQTIADLLGRLGCVVDTAQDGAEAMALLASQSRYDLVLSDIKMPHKNGYEIFAAAKKLNHAPPVILMTGFGYNPNHAIVRASQEGLAAVLFKPFKVEKLVGEVRRAVGVEG